MTSNFQDELSALLDKYAEDGPAMTLDHVLARYIAYCLLAFDATAADLGELRVISTK